MRFPSRPVLTASVLAALAASGGTALTMPSYSPGPAGTPDLSASPELSAAASATDPAAVGPPVSGAQIAGLALAPARDRAGALAAERAAAAAAAQEAAQRKKAAAEAAAAQRKKEAEAESQRRARPDDWQEFRRQLEKACDDGRIRGQICRGT